MGIPFNTDLDIKKNEIQNAVVQNLSTAPSNPKAGQIYFNTVDKTLYVFADNAWADALRQGTTYTEGSGIDITGGVISIDNTVTSATKCKVTYNGQGLITAGADLEATDIPNLTLAKITDVTATATELNVLDGITATTAELNILDGVTATAIELNILDGATLTTTELNYVGGVTSAIQTQLNGKLAVKPDGTNDLIDNSDKVATVYLPDVILGQLLYAGAFDPTTAEATLTTNAKTKLGTTSSTITLTNDTTPITGYEANEGCFYICSDNGTFASISFLVGDWLVSTGSGWTKIDNTDAVTGVKGNAESTYRIGNVNITADNVLPTQTSNSGKFLTTDGTNCSWATVDAFPTQTGNSGKFLTTDGTMTSWAEAVTPSGTQTLTNKTIDGDDNTIQDLGTGVFKSGVLQTTVRATSSASDTALATEKAIATALATKVGKISANNTALTPSGGVATWTVSNTLGTADVTVQVFENSSNTQVMAEVAATSSTVTIKMNAADTVAADTYRVVIIG